MQTKNTDPIYEFYTNHPFPPPVSDLDRAREIWDDENIHHAEHHLLWPHKEYRADVDVLIAGCGTWQAAKYALCHPAAHVTAIDVSPTSLEHTWALAKKYDLNDLKIRQLAIENVAELDQQFDLIICTGVLHHLADPDVGLRALRSVLKPDGAMYLMVYAPYGRAGVYMLQEYCRRLGIGTSEQEINDLISVLKVLPDFHPLLAAQAGSREFPSGPALADALLNPRDVAYSVPQLFDFVERNDLRLTRFYWQAAYLPYCGSISTTPHVELLATLPKREQYIAMELWRGLMSNHSIVVHRSDMNGQALEVSFDDQRCLHYVPFRLPWTICVTEKLPPQFTGALLNQTHLFPDLYLFIDEKYKQIYDAIDGRRTIGQIVGMIEGAGPRVRDFFQQLWWYDQVVFDTSKANTAST
jgi:SAM-dependent methyltransferase